MKNEDICYMSACDMKDAIASQKLTSQEITEIIIERIEKINPIVNAYCTTTFNLAREMAKSADEAIKKNQNKGLLQGIPLSIKDEMPMKGIRSTFGSKLYENNIPEQDDIAVHRLKEACCVILGRVNMPEFGHIALTTNKIFGETKNPWDREKNSGGSSGGSAAAVASGLGPLSLGADGGGSIRVPSSLCGVFGLKTTFGRIPRYPTTGIAFWTLDSFGPITRYVKDAALMLNVMKGHHPADCNSFPDEGIDYVKILEEKPENLKIGYTVNLGFYKAPDEEVEKNVVESARKLAKFDWTVEEVTLKLKSPESSFKTLVSTGFSFDLEKDLQNRREDLSPDLIPTIELGLTSNSTNIGKAMEQRRQLYEDFYQYFNNYDILITPTTPCPAFKLEQTKLGTKFPIVNKKALSIMSWMAYTYPFNLVGLPAASIPCGFSKTGLPIGMQIVGRRFDEKTVLQVSKTFEEIAPWQDKKPKFD